MCGIAGIFNAQHASDRLEQMLSAIFHRGPDESGTYRDSSLSMGMRRLSIIDLQDGSQPIANEDGRYNVVFNGEIYNYRELREGLLRRGHVLRTKSDTEVIVHLFEEHGIDCLQYLRGMFAFALWDRHARELYIARDRMGIKPLYYAKSNGSLVFGSEIKSLLCHPDIKAEVDLAGLSHFLSLKYVPAPHTLFRGIESLPPGHYLRARGEDIELRSYWDIPSAASKCHASLNDDRDSSATRLLELLRESVRLRLRSDVPFGAFLSGGVDSSLIVALMSEALSEPVKTFSVGFGGEGLSDELPYAKQVADQFGCEHHTFKITANDFLQHAETVLYHLDQPIADQATVATFMVAKLARQHVKMVLTGEGGDELFAGYARYAGERFSPWFRYCPDQIGWLIRKTSARLPGMRRAKIAINALTYRSEATRFAQWFPMFSDDAKAELIASDNCVLRVGAGEVFAEHLRRCGNTTPLSRMLYVDSKLWLPDYLLLRGDKLTMANSLEARVPLLDHKLVEFATGLPDDAKLSGRSRKHLLRQVARKLLPSQIIDRKKQGFPIPIENWLRKEAKSLVHDTLSQHSVTQRGLFDWQAVSRLVREHESEYADHATQIWGLVSLEMWFRQFVDQPVRGDRVAPINHSACSATSETLS